MNDLETKRRWKELELADLDVLVWASRSPFFVVISREVSISCACGTLLVSSFFWNSPWLFSFLLASFCFDVTPQPKNIKEKLNHFISLFLFFSFSFPFFTLCLENMLSTIRLVFFFFFYTLNFQADTRRVHFRCLVTHGSSLIPLMAHHLSLMTHHSWLITHHSWLITHHSWLITHYSSLITHGSSTHHSLLIIHVFHSSWLLASIKTPGSPQDLWLPSGLLVSPLDSWLPS